MTMCCRGLLCETRAAEVGGEKGAKVASLRAATGEPFDLFDLTVRVRSCCASGGKGDLKEIKDFLRSIS
jgi:hypothetical protein